MTSPTIVFYPNHGMMKIKKTNLIPIYLGITKCKAKTEVKLDVSTRVDEASYWNEITMRLDKPSSLANSHLEQLNE
jgi:hypothetical protein